MSGYTVQQGADAFAAAGTGNAETLAWVIRDVRDDAGVQTADELVADLRVAGFGAVADQLVPPAGAR